MKTIRVSFGKNEESEIPIPIDSVPSFWDASCEIWELTARPGIRNIESSLEWLIARWNLCRPDLLVFPADIAGHELAVRMSARLGCPCLPETRNISLCGNGFSATKKVCGSNLDWECFFEPPLIVTLLPTGNEKIATNIIKNKIVKNDDARPANLPKWLLSYECPEKCPDNPLEHSRLVFVAGRGMGSSAACKRLAEIAVRRNAVLGFSRAAALNGWGSTSDIIGQSGIRIKADVCVAVGVSGSAAFMTGIETAGQIIAVNTDCDAPIFRNADFGIVASADEFMSAMEGPAL